MKYRIYDLGFGLHICPEIEDCLILNLEVVNTSLGKLEAPKSELSEDDWDAKWKETCVFAELIVERLNNNVLTSSEARVKITYWNGLSIDDGWEEL